MNLYKLEPTMAVSPIIFTCVVGETKNSTKTLPYFISPDEQQDKRYWIGQTSQAWIDLQATERDGCFSSGWLYVSQLFPDGFIDSLNNSYCNFIKYLAENDWETELPELALFPSESLLINTANATHQAVPIHTLVSLFTTQVHARPNATAVIDANGVYDYQTIQRKILSLSFSLHKKGIVHNQLIAVLCEKGLNQVVATLGVMAVGAAYLPLNVEWPLGRIKDILIEGAVSHLLVSEMQWQIIKNTEFVNEYTIHRIEIISENKYDKALSITINPNGPAYVIFTSGSTGKPKGVCISHAGAVNTLLTVNKALGVNENDIVLALSELSFDLSVYDLFGVLGAGGIVVFPDQQLTKEPTHWVTLIKKHKITLWNSVPQLIQLLLDNSDDHISHLRLILLSGDWVPLRLVSQIKAFASQPKVISLGGATEASIWSIWYDISDSVNLNFVPYGFPMPNQNVYVLNAFDEHCPIGVAGEIYLGGIGLALGYWKNKQGTTEHFIIHSKLGRLYKTGDLGKWNAAGYIEFLGRKDNQVKRNGNRVELDEIATKLIQLKGIDNAVVRIHNDRLVAYLVSSDFKSKYADDFNIEQFKLTQHGLRTDLCNSLVFNAYQFNDAAYHTYKSYRQFSSERISSNLMILPAPKDKSNPTQYLENLHDLALLLSVLNAKKYDDKVLPKYLYPSAGSTYSVFCIVHIPEQLAELQAGCYYYHPVLHSLQLINNCEINANFSLEFSFNHNAIEPLYGKDALRLACLECGHMLYLLTHLLQEKNIAYALQTEKSQGDNYLATLILNTNNYQDFFNHKLNTIILEKQNSSVFKASNREFNLFDQAIFMQTSELGHILNSAQTLVIFESEHNNISAWIEAGFTAQHYINHWQTLKLAYCPLGFCPYDNAIYALALGIMRRSEEHTS